jgi:hypothetical protein
MNLYSQQPGTGSDRTGQPAGHAIIGQSAGVLFQSRQACRGKKAAGTCIFIGRQTDLPLAFLATGIGFEPPGGQ